MGEANRYSQMLANLHGMHLFTFILVMFVLWLMTKHQMWDLVNGELQRAVETLSTNGAMCKLILEAKLYQQRGNFFRRCSITTSGFERLPEALDFYRLGKGKMEANIWSNCISTAKEENASNTTLCDALFASEKIVRRSFECLGKRVKEVSCDEVKCWHCFPSESSVSSWQCFWDHTTIDKVAPIFKAIIEESTKDAEEDNPESKSVWRTKRRQLDQCLGDLLRTCKLFDSLLKKLRKDLQSKCGNDVHESILKLVIGGDSQRVECLSKLILKKGCYVGGIESSSKQEGAETCYQRENIPGLRYEVYRMLSVAGILYTYGRCHHYRQKVGTEYAGFPMIDPLDAYYLLNPGGDCKDIEALLGNLLNDKILEASHFGGTYRKIHTEKLEEKYLHSQIYAETRVTELIRFTFSRRQVSTNFGRGLYRQRASSPLSR
ncbi:hypothetical protein Ccrd_014553 [Cynara cardunculus var. scolymus]|uniref:Uncharacterized protein n=1 Tax=Cynara cardunculus var. scolymus TaxID=59895 RepID=A0A103YDH1_CYNCS|nr:hypothetical protein Ccrd_014553 [Cynara cardunculus var. scolymus]